MLMFVAEEMSNEGCESEPVVVDADELIVSKPVYFLFTV